MSQTNMPADGDLGGRRRRRSRRRSGVRGFRGFRGLGAVKRRRKATGACLATRKFAWKSTRAGARCFSSTKSGRGRTRVASSRCCGGSRKGLKAAKGGLRRRAFGLPFWISAGRSGRRCTMRTPHGWRFQKTARCKNIRTSLTGYKRRRANFRGAEGMNMGLLQSDSIAILGDAGDLFMGDGFATDGVEDADLDGRRRRVSGRRRAKSHCVAVKKGKGGACACARKAPGKAKAGAFKAKCSAKGLRVRRPGRGLRGFRGFEMADQEFMLDGTNLGAPSVPKKCTKWEVMRSPALGRDVKVCTVFDGMDEIDDAPLAGPLAKWAGLGQVGGGFGPTAGVLVGGVVAALLSRYAGSLGPLANIPGGGLVLAGLLAAGAAAYPKTRQAGIGALAGVITVGAYKMLSGPGAGASAGWGAIVPDVDGFGAIVPDVDGFGAHVDVLSDYDGFGDDDDDDDDDDEGMEGMGEGIDVLSGAFGSLPFAGAH